MKKILLLIAVIAAFCGELYAASPEQEVRQSYFAMADKMARLDISGVLGMLADDYVEIDGSGKSHTKAELFQKVGPASSAVTGVLALKTALRQNDLEKVLDAVAVMRGETLSPEVRESVRQLPPEQKAQMLAEFKNTLAPMLDLLDKQFSQMENWRKSLRVRSVKITGDRADVVATQQKLDDPSVLERSTTTLVKRDGKWLFLKTVITTGIPGK